MVVRLRRRLSLLLINSCACGRSHDFIFINSLILSPLNLKSHNISQINCSRSISFSLNFTADSLQDLPMILFTLKMLRNPELLT